MARYVFENSLIASASLGSVKIRSTSFFIDTFKSNSAKSFALFDFSPTTILLGCKLSNNARPSRKNSGEKIILLLLKYLRLSSTNPTGIVDLIIIIASGFILVTSLRIPSTDDVSKKLVFSS